MDILAMGVDGVQRQFEPLLAQVNVWKDFQLGDSQAKEIIYGAFVRERVDCPKHIMRDVDHLYFEPQYEEFKPRNLDSLQNAFTSAFKALEPLPLYRATNSAGEFFEIFS